MVVRKSGTLVRVPPNRNQVARPSTGLFRNAANIALYTANRLRLANRARTLARSQARRPKVRRLGGDVGHGQAWKRTKRQRPLRPGPRVNKRFKRKVETIIDYGKPYGQYHFLSDNQLRQVDRDTYGYYSTDNNAIGMTHFTPYQIWDAASVCFNNKAAHFNPTVDLAQGITHNVRYKQEIHIINSYVKMDFKSTSSHVVNIEMYVCYPKSNANVENVDDAIIGSGLQVNSTYSLLNTSNAVVSGTWSNFANILSTPAMWSQLYRDYKVTKTQFKFNPGEKKSHFLQGPKNFTVDGTTMGDNANTLNTAAKWSPSVFFRVLNDATVNGVTTGTTATTCVSQWPSNYRGGVAFTQERVIRLRMPTTLDAAVAIDTQAGNMQNTIVFGRWRRLHAYDEDQQVCVEQPAQVGLGQ